MIKTMKVAAAVFYILLLTYVVFFARRRESIQDTRRIELINVIPVINQINSYQGLAPNDEKGKRHFALNIIGNILLFIPLPFFFYIFGFVDKKKILLTAFLTTSGIEVTQLFFHIGVPDIDDVLLNITGAFLGLLLLGKIPVLFRSPI